MINGLRLSSLQDIGGFSNKTWKMLAILAVIFVLSYFGTLSQLVKTWFMRSDYAHGFLVPFISLYFIWLKREKLKAISVKPNIIGGVTLTAIGVLLLLMGKVSSVLMIELFSIVVMIPGLVWLLLGTAYLRALALPLSYLILMVPILDLFLMSITWPFQLFSASMSARIFEFFNLPIYRYEQFIEFPNITIEVAKECSGLHFLVSIIAIGIPLAIFTLREWWLRVALVLSAVVIGILSNGLRVALIGFWTYRGGEGIHGPWHIFQGFFVSVIGFIFLFLFAWFLTKFSSPEKQKHIEKSTQINQMALEGDARFYRAWFIAMTILTLSGSYIYVHTVTRVPLKKDLQEFPLTIGKWIGRNITFPKKLPRAKGADSEISRVYVNNNGDKILLYVGYFESQNQNKEIVHYLLQDLYYGKEYVQISLSSKKSIKVNKKIYLASPGRYMVLYWYDLNGKAIASRYKAKLMTSIDGLIRGRTNGAIIMLYSPMKNSGKSDEVFSNEDDFARNLIGVLGGYLPSPEDRAEISNRLLKNPFSS